jgi:catechol 2,3-dioxygenase
MAVDKAAISAMEPPKGMPFQIRKLGHTVLYVSDLQRSVDWYTQRLGFRLSDVYDESMMAGGMAFLRFGPDHHSLALVGDGEKPGMRRGLHHIAFELATLREVIDARDHLRRHGVTIVFEGRRRAGCQIAVEFLDPDGHHLELYWGLDQIGTDNHLRPPEEWRPARTIEEAIANPPPGQDFTLPR